MRLEATVPDSRGQAVDQLATELGLSRSQVIDEALAVFMQAVSAIRRGQRLCAVDPRDQNLDCLIVTPTLSALEWAANPEPLNISADALTKVRERLAEAPVPGTSLRSAAARFKQ